MRVYVQTIIIIIVVVVIIIIIIITRSVLINDLLDADIFTK
jgi:hypothetical protein